MEAASVRGRGSAVSSGGGGHGSALSSGDGSQGTTAPGGAGQSRPLFEPSHRLIGLTMLAPRSTVRPTGNLYAAFGTYPSRKRMTANQNLPLMKAAVQPSASSRPKKGRRWIAPLGSRRWATLT